MAVMTVREASTPAAKVPARKRDSARQERHERLWYTILGLAIPAACFLSAWALHGSTASTYRIGSQWSALTGLFVLALAIERGLEPFSPKLGPDTAKRKEIRDRALASPPADDKEDQAVRRHRAVETSRRLTAIVTWGVATGLAFLLCAQLNITLLQAVRANGSGQPPFWADLLVTGLVVGAGTKPLHDLVSDIEHGKNAKQDPPATNPRS